MQTAKGRSRKVPSAGIVMALLWKVRTILRRMRKEVFKLMGSCYLRLTTRMEIRGALRWRLERKITIIQSSRMRSGVRLLPVLYLRGGCDVQKKEKSPLYLRSAPRGDLATRRNSARSARSDEMQVLNSLRLLQTRFVRR